MDLKEALQSIKNQLIPMQLTIAGNEITAYYRPMTLADHDKIKNMVKAATGGKAGDMPEGLQLAMTVIHKVCDGQGNRVFSISDKDMLMQSPQGVLVDITNALTDDTTVEAAEKN